jgi:putative spermidine/putrescine transport system ATP-binding protein
VGISNIVSGAAAQQITNSNSTFSIRPEKIRMVALDSPTPPDSYSVVGVVRDVVYLGMHTRYLIELATGSDLTVVQQNLETTSMDVLAAKGRQVKLVWRRDFNRVIERGA